MTHRALLLLAPTLALACSGDLPHTPTLDEIDPSADGALDVVDRDAALAGASEDEAGPVLDLSDPASGFRMDISGHHVAEELEAAGASDAEGDGDGAPAEPATYQAITTGLLAVGAADLAAALVVGPPAAAIAIALDGEISQVDERLWSATNSVTSAQGVTVTADFNVAWVGVGWLAEMRISSDDGTYDDTLWFNGFVSLEGALGWWDLYADGQVVGVVEWIADGEGNGQAGIAATAGAAAGDVLYYLALDGEDHVGYYDASEDFESYVHVDVDRSGEVVLLDRNDSLPLCWDAEYADVSCD